MQITVLGTRGEIDDAAPTHARRSGILIDSAVLFDIGEREYLDLNPEVIFVTHLHPDHAFFVVEPAPIDAPLYGPESFDNGVRVEEIHTPLTIRGLTVTPIPTHHSKRVKSAAYLITDGEKRCLYTGDLIWINKEYHPMLEGTDLVITDGSFLRKGGRVFRDRETGQIYGHAGIPDLIRLFSAFTREILFVHFGNWFFADIEASVTAIERLGDAEGIHACAGYDGMAIDL
jgi:ribonuclease BN (tRNA processing enzyme)